MSNNARRAVHEAITALLDPGEIAVSWCVVIDVAGPDDTRYLAHVAGGGIDGQDPPLVWHALGMLSASATQAQQQLLEDTNDDPPTHDDTDQEDM